MILTKTNILYAVIAVVFGLVVAFGYAGLSYHPLPLQVKEDLYIPAPAPTAAIPTLAPQPIKGSTADKPADPNDKFAPAQAPVVVTTAPLPTITPEPTGTNDCCVNSNWNSTYQSVFTLIQVVGLILCLVVGILVVVQLMGVVGGGNEDGYIEGVITFLVAGVMLVVFLPMVLSIMSSVMTAAPCIC